MLLKSVFIIAVVAVAMIGVMVPSVFAEPVLYDEKLVIQEYARDIGWGYTTMTFVGDDILLLQKIGVVSLIRDGVIQEEPVLEIDVNPIRESGLLGVTSVGSIVYLYFTEVDSEGEQLGNRIYKYDWNGEKLVNPVLLKELPSNEYHNSGSMVTGLDDAGHIYEKEIIQFYCNNDKKFLPDRYVKGICPYCKAEDQYSDLCESCGRVPEEITDPKCSLCGQTPTKEKTNHYFFKLKNFADSLSKWLDETTTLQKDVKKYVQNWIKSGLIDWDITRDIPWGVPVPLDGAEGKVFYGWFDNHLAYISTALKFLNDNGIDGKEFWNSADIYHFIGKDIVYHHYLFLPAMRLGINQEYKLPDYIPTRGHLTLQGKKISKSRNWYIGLKQFLEYYPADYLRFYLVSINPYSQDDLNFDWDDFTTRINSELIGNLGNFVNRALGFTKKTFDGKIPEIESFDEKDSEAEQKIKSLAADVSTLMEQNHLDRALKKIMEVSSFFNQYFQHKEPWKNGPGTTNCVYLSVNAVRSFAIAIFPFMPESAQKIWNQLGIDGNVANISWSSQSELGISSGHVLGDPYPLFARIEKSDIEKYKTELGPSQ